MQDSKRKIDSNHTPIWEISDLTFLGFPLSWLASLKALWHERHQITFGLHAAKELCHYARGDGGQQNAIAEMTGSKEVARQQGCPEYGKSVWCGWPQTCPRFVHPKLTDFRHQVGRRLMQPLDRLRHDLFVVADVFHGRTDDDAAVAARHDIDIVSTNSVAKQLAVRGNHSER